ncbi:hypothetical protein, conserved [Babesia ovata]|uniref:Extracellular matrix-binding ebh n=1 Tax=Babesia ovata TaxID=189622 RepID=A0A2H6KJL2_9APIC|nr:uncharacterized protein BOVATA_046700 [Babesia ovata]GBE63177.1 hypothetical protein, conserved [Babesia ovata]
MGFIGKSEEVQNALVKGLQSNVNQLDKLLKASCGDKGCCEYNDEKFIKEQLKSVQNNFKEAEKDDKRLNNILADGNITQLQSQLVQPKKQIQQKIDELNQRISELKKADENAKKSGQSLQNASEIDKLNKDLDSHNASKRSLETLSGICGYAVSLIQKPKNDGECKDILDKLCSGLENFLGFNPESKGYSGDGIVYSDLDRLCDGVMSFLHGVLHNIQPKLGLHKDKITRAIESLNTHKHTGKEGFKIAIGEVVQGVKQYNEGVVKSNNLVKEPIEDLLGFLREDGDGKFIVEYNKIQVGKVSGDPKAEDEQVKSADGLLKTCLRNTETFRRGIDNAAENVLDLNNNCAIKVKHAVSNIDYEYDRLATLSNKEEEDRLAVEKRVNEQLGKVEIAVKNKVAADIKVFRDHVIDKLKVIRIRLQHVEWKLAGYVTGVEKTWKKDAESIVKEVEEKLEKALEQVDGSTKSVNKSAIDNAAREIERQAEILKQKFDEVKRQYEEAFKIIKGTEGVEKSGVVNQLTELYETVKMGVPADDLVRYTSGEWDVNKQIAPLSGAIQSNVEGYVKTLWDAVAAGMQGVDDDYGAGTKGVEALQRHVGLNLQKLGLFGTTLQDVLSKVLQQGSNSDLPSDLETVLYFLKDAKVNWESANPPLEDLLKPLQEAFSTKAIADDFKTHLRDLLKETAEKGIGKLNDLIKTQVVDTINQKVKPLEDILEENAKLAKTELEQKAQEITSRLLSICKAVTEQGGGTKDELQVLKNRTRNFFEGIKQDVERLKTGKVATWISEVGELIKTEVPNYAKSAIETINRELTTQVNNAKTNILKTVRKRYVTSIQLLLNQFADKVETELNPLPQQIEDDKHIGYKGFMNTLSGYNSGNNLNRFDGNNSVETLSYAFSAFGGPVNM